MEFPFLEGFDDIPERLGNLRPLEGPGIGMSGQKNQGVSRLLWIFSTAHEIA
jgi:hypothetical protein